MSALLSGTARYADRPPDWIWRVQYPYNTKKAEVYYRSDSFGQVAAIVNYGRPVKSPRDFARINGIVARFQAYAYAVVMLTDGTQFPDGNEQMHELPEGFERREVE